MTFCESLLKKWLIFIISGVALILGILTVIFWESLYRTILHHQLSLGNSHTTQYNLWKETPIPMYIEFYLFNFSNVKDVQKDWSIKPIFHEMGPYTYSEHHIREEIQFNTNNTLNFKTKKIWKFLPEKSNGTLDDKITIVNVVVATVGYMVRNRHKIVQMGVNFFMEEKKTPFYVTKTAREFIFDGYEDPMLDLVKKLNISAFNVPFDKFAWFYGRNESTDFDGLFTMYDGSDDIKKLGRIILWNRSNRTINYDGNCGIINGTNGELWYPVGNDNTATIFSSDICSSLTLVKDSNYTIHGLEGVKFVGNEKIFDNGTNYPDMSCFNPGISVPSGVRNVSQCKFGAPAFISYPHFYLADPFYKDAVVGMKPNKSLHEFSMSIEPNTGIPLKVQVAIQINMYLPKIDGIKMLKNIKPFYMPMMWFRQTADLSENLANTAKLLLILPSFGTYTGYGVVIISCLLFIIGLFIFYRKNWKD